MSKIQQGFRVTDKAIVDVIVERERQLELAHGGDTETFDKGNTQNDWVAYISAYSGRASQKVARNERQNEEFRANMVKTAALAIAAIQAHDKGYC
jgi:hypothetical protein